MYIHICACWKPLVPSELVPRSAACSPEKCFLGVMIAFFVSSHFHSL